MDSNGFTMKQNKDAYGFTMKQKNGHQWLHYEKTKMKWTHMVSL